MSRTITLTDDQEALLQRLLDEGRFENESQAITAGLHAMADDSWMGDWTVEELRAAVQEGIDSGPGVPAEQVFAELREMLRQKYGPDPRA